jgi:hypothetical protein
LQDKEADEIFSRMVRNSLSLRSTDLGTSGAETDTHKSSSSPEFLNAHPSMHLEKETPPSIQEKIKSQHLSNTDSGHSDNPKVETMEVRPFFA